MSRLQVPVFAMSARALSLYRSMQRRSGIALLGSAALLSAGFCLAAENALADRASASVAAVRGMALGPTLSIGDVCDRLEKAGYREFQEVEWDDGLYKVKATASDGRLVKLYVDGRSGEVLRVRSKG
ncbi:PepSY domain-containing protein [Comamonas testosteroni]|uniref:PepSY domain-containing protein n=1 Tax=Comamonas testosteroni TaxID=285 RepID=UPI002660401A|nr:PepSY domain-containing protein [Comamonas testosteroni]WKL17093.1 PepSY domain-containing protein [Comamonas testosteroni]